MKNYYQIIFTLIFISTFLFSFDNISITKSINNEKVLKFYPNFSKSYSGTINNRYEIEVKLINESNQITGEYSYKNQTQSLRLSGTIDSNGSVQIKEYNSKNIITGSFTGKIEGTIIKGLWKNKDQTKVYNFEISEKSNEKKPLSRITLGNYQDEFERNLTISKSNNEGSINFKIEQFDNNCAESIEGTAIFKDSLLAVYNNVDENCKITLNFQGDKITVEDSDCSHGAACGNFGGTYKKQK